jgi:hypothetical protein
MATHQDIEAYLGASGYALEEVAERTWLLRHGHDDSPERIAVRLEHDLVLFRLKVLDLARVRDRPGLFQALLELNASEMLYGAYGVADGAVMLTSAISLSSLDLQELRNVVEEFNLSLHKHRELLARHC